MRKIVPTQLLQLARTLTVGFLLTTGTTQAQSASWALFNAGNAPIANDIREIRQQGNVMWVLGPTAIFSKQGSQWTTYPLPGTYVNGFPAGGRALHVDTQGNKWIGTSEETLRLDGQGTFTTIGGGLIAPPLRYDDDIVADQLGNLFFVSSFDGLFRYDGTGSTYLTGGNNGLRRMIIAGSTYWFTSATELVRYDGNLQRSWYLNPSIFFSDLRLWNGLIWVASEQGLQRFSPTTLQWQAALTPNNSSLPSRYVNCLFVDSQNALWAGTRQGLARYDGTSWQVFNSANSPLPVNDVRNLFEDSFGNLWIGTATGGVAVYHAGGILGTTNPVAAGTNNSFTIAPNPASSTARLHFTAALPQRLVVTDAIGREVLDLSSKPATYEVPLAGLPAGRYTVCATFADGRSVRQPLSKGSE
jgi:Two component regulator propeller